MQPTKKLFEFFKKDSDGSKSELKKRSVSFSKLTTSEQKAVEEEQQEQAKKHATAKNEFATQYAKTLEDSLHQTIDTAYFSVKYIKKDSVIKICVDHEHQLKDVKTDLNNKGIPFSVKQVSVVEGFTQQELSIPVDDLYQKYLDSSQAEISIVQGPQ